MVVILKPKTSNEEIKKLTGELESLGVTVNPVKIKTIKDWQPPTSVK